MAKLKITLQTGEVAEVEGRRFSHYVENVRFWFFLHKEIGGFGQVVTHYDSGKRVLHIPRYVIAAALGDVKAAAKSEIDKLVSRVGGARVRSVLSANSK